MKKENLRVQMVSGWKKSLCVCAINSITGSPFGKVGQLWQAVCDGSLLIHVGFKQELPSCSSDNKFSGAWVMEQNTHNNLKNKYWHYQEKCKNAIISELKEGIQA